MERNSQLNPTPLRNTDEAVDLCVNVEPSSMCRGEYAKFTPEQQASIARYACMHFSVMEASHTLRYTW